MSIKSQRGVFLSGYSSFTVKRAGILTCPYPKFGARLEVDNDLSLLFPYVNSSIKGSLYFGNPERVQFLFGGVQCTLYSYEIIAAAFQDQEHALDFGELLMNFLNDLYDRKDSIAPNYRKVRTLSPLEVYKILPRTNCGECGLPSCLAFAGALSKGKASVNQCPGIARPIEEKAVYPVLDREGRLMSTIELDLPEREGETIHQQRNVRSLLTDRELEVLQLLARGLTNPEISKELFISPHTVKTHVVHIYEKLGVSDRAQAAVLATRYNLV